MAKTIVFLHGLGGDCDAWNYLKPTIINKGFNYIAIDLPGHGYSYRLDQNYRLRDLEDAVLAVLKQEDINNIFIMGHSLGSFVSLDLTIHHPDKISHLILLNSSYNCPSWFHVLKILPPIFTFFKIDHICEHVEPSQFYGTKDISIKRLKSDIKHVGPISFFRLYASLANWNKEKELSKIKVKTLVIGGTKDMIASANKSHYLASHIPNSKLVVLPISHTSMLNSQKEIINILLNNIFI